MAPFTRASRALTLVVIASPSAWGFRVVRVSAALVLSDLAAAIALVRAAL
jgi:hypothetical protein